MSWPNLYGWEPGDEPDWVHEARKDEIKRVKEAQAKTKRAELGIIKAIAAEVITAEVITGDMLAEVRRRAAIKGVELGALAVRNRLAALGYRCDGLAVKFTGWPVRWSDDIRRHVENWLATEPLVKAGRYDYVTLEAVADSCARWALHTADEDISESLSARSMRRVLESEGFGLIKYREGQLSLVNHKLKYK